MATGDVNILGPFNPQDTTVIDTALTGAVVVADKLEHYMNKGGQIYFVIVKA